MTGAGAVPAPGVTIERLEAPAEIARLEPEWDALARAVVRAPCFALPGYFRVWRRLLAGDVAPAVLAARAGGELRGVMPIMRAQVRRGPTCAPRHDFAPSDRALVERRPRPIPVRQVSPVVSIPATLVGPVPLCHDCDTALVTAAMARALLALRGWDVIVLPVYEGVEQESWRAAFAAEGRNPHLQELGRFVQSIRDLRPFDAIVAGQKKKYRQNVRRARAAAEKAGLRLAVHEGQAEVAARLATLEAVARASWKHLGREDQQVALPYAGRQQAFFEALLGEPDTGLTPMLVTAEADGGAVAVMLAVRHGATLTALLTFHDGRCAAASPGLLILGRLIDWAAEHGIRWLDLNATHEWVRYLADERRAQNNLVVFAPTLRGRLYELIARKAGSLQ